MELTLEQWQQIGVAAGMALTVLVTLVASLWLSRQTLVQAKRFWATVKGQEATILEQIDEPTDVLPRLVERYTGVPAPITSALLTALVKTMLEHLDVPVREVRMDEVVK